MLNGIAANLGDPALIREYVREYHRRSAALRQAIARDKLQIERQLGEAVREADRLAAAIAKGADVDSVRAALLAAETKKANLRAALVDSPSVPIALHPSAADAYQRKIADLRTAMESARPNLRAEAFEIIRELVDQIVVVPAPAIRGSNQWTAAPPELEIRGRLAALLKATAAPDDRRRSNRSGVLLVAGEGFEPPTSGL